MLTDGDIDGLEEQLSKFKVSSAEHTSALQVCLMFGAILFDATYTGIGFVTKVYIHH
jgi:hypothetical protein